MSIIEAKELTFSYKSENGKKVVLDNLNLNIEKGSFQWLKKPLGTAFLCYSQFIL